jgi:hypothetical protein
MNVSYRRAVQALFAIHLDNDDIGALRTVLDRLVPVEELDDTGGAGVERPAGVWTIE